MHYMMKQMAEMFDVTEHTLRFYTDGVTPYRLEMQAKVEIGDAKNLYEYWGDLLYHSVIDDSRIIINLASKEYEKCIEKYLTPQDRYITVAFCELSGDKLVTKGTYAKMARGEMVRFMAENNIDNPIEIQKFDRLGYFFGLICHQIQNMFLNEKQNNVLD